MARRKRKEEVPVWEPPEFDEVGYMRKEIENAKISIVVVAWAVVGALLAYLFYTLNLAIVGFLLGLLVFGALYFLLPMLGLPIRGFKRRDWASHAMVYFFSWLAFSILLLNAPFGDHTYPVVGSFEVGTFPAGANGSGPLPNSIYCYAVSPGSLVRIGAITNNTVYVLFRATDNAAMGSIRVQVGSTNVSPVSVAGQATACKNSTLAVYLPDTYAVSFPSSGAPWIVQVTAVDTAGLATTESIRIESP